MEKGDSTPMSDAFDGIDLKAILDEHADCDYTKRVPSGLESLDPAGIKRIVDASQGSDRPVVLKFGKDFCGWTKKLNRVLQDVVPLYRDKADFYEVNLPSYEHLWEEWNITTSPMTVLIKDGKEVARSDAAEAFEVPPVFEAWFGPPSK